MSVRLMSVKTFTNFSVDTYKGKPVMSFMFPLGSTLTMAAEVFIKSFMDWNIRQSDTPPKISHVPTN